MCRPSIQWSNEMNFNSQFYACTCINSNFIEAAFLNFEQCSVIYSKVWYDICNTERKKYMRLKNVYKLNVAWFAEIFKIVN